MLNGFIPYSPDEHDEILNEITNNLQNQISKLQSQRLHLQSLIAKRDRLDYEIKTLKQVIQRTKKFSTQKGKSLREEAKAILEETELVNEKVVVSSFVYEKFLQRLEVELANLKSEEELVEILTRLPRIDEN